MGQWSMLGVLAVYSVFAAISEELEMYIHTQGSIFLWHIHGKAFHLFMLHPKRKKRIHNDLLAWISLVLNLKQNLAGM